MDAHDHGPIPLTPDDQRFVEDQVRSGRYASPEAVLREGLRQLQDWEQFVQSNREQIREQIEEGFAASERGEVVDGPSVMEEWRLGDEAAKRQQKRRA